MSDIQDKANRPEAFVNYVMQCVKNNNNKIVAALRRADNPATEYQSWEQLTKFNVALDRPSQRLPFTIIAAAIAKAKIESNGIDNIGQALAKCYEDKNKSEQAKIKLRRLLACESTEELCGILRSFLCLIQARTSSINYIQLLNDLLNFKRNSQRIKAKWAEGFYKAFKCEENA